MTKTEGVREGYPSKETPTKMMYVVWHRDGYSRRKGQREHPELQMSHLHAVNTDVVESINIAAPHHVAWTKHGNEPA
jgi:hypothetical protein